MEVKGSPFSLRIGKDVRETRKGATDIFRADRRVSKYKTHEEQRAERRNYYSEREIPVSAPQAPPRSKKKRQSFREFQVNFERGFGTSWLYGYLGRMATFFDRFC